jgi:hypothetical protein
MLSNGEESGAPAAGSGEENGGRELEGKTSLEVKGRRQEILEREGATKRGRKSQEPYPLIDQAPHNSKVCPTRPPHCVLMVLSVSFRPAGKPKKKSRLIGMCGSFHRSIITTTRF